MTRTSYHFDWRKHQGQLIKFFQALEAAEELNKKTLAQIGNQFTKAPGQLFKKSELVQAYRAMAGQFGLKPKQQKIMQILRKKPIRTASGVAVVTVLTKPYPCPGQCIFCPVEARMPKSYLPDEPGAQRAEKNHFDPYLQTYNRLLALHQIGHNIDKVELIVLGGTWTAYPQAYQRWFIRECLRAMNDLGSCDDRQAVLERVESAEPEVASWSQLEAEQLKNETAAQRCVGLVLETRPDEIDQEEVLRLRHLGATKIQLGIQSLQDEVLKKNKRGHDVATTQRAIKLLRQAGFKIHGHWMPNLYGSNVEQDKKDYKRMFVQPDFRPDELKIYPCSLLESAELMEVYQAGQWQPYSHDELLEVLSYVLTHTPQYCRLTRVVRDIPSPEIVAGNKKTNFRQIASQALKKAGRAAEMTDIRAREIRREKFKLAEVILDEICYKTSLGEERFLQFVWPQAEGSAKILAFLRLSLPSEPSFMEELGASAVIREIHVYGQAVQIGETDEAKPQHAGFGTKLIERAKKIAVEAGCKQLAVISAIGTREYYRKKGFSDGKLYQFMPL